MPDRVDLVKEAIARFDTLGMRSQLLALDTPTLEDLGLLLSDREISVREAWVRLNKALGVDVTAPGGEAGEAVDIRAVYRWAEKFRPVYAQVRAEHARRIARLSVAAATGEQADAMTRVAQARVTELLAEKLVEANSIEELSSSQVAATLMMVDGWTKAGLKREELALKVADAERKTLDSEARRAELQTRIDALPARIKAIEDRLAEAEQARARGKSIDPNIFRAIRQELTAMAPPGMPASATAGGAA
jgi:hypothetical protein